MNYNQINNSWLCQEPSLYRFYHYSSSNINNNMLDNIVATEKKKLTSADLRSPVLVSKAAVIKNNQAQWSLYQEKESSVVPLSSQPKKLFGHDYNNHNNHFTPVITDNNQVSYNDSLSKNHSGNMHSKGQQRQQRYYCSSNVRSSFIQVDNEVASVTARVNKLTDGLHDVHVTDQTSNILQCNINKQRLPHMYKQTQEQYTYTSADLSDNTATALPSTTKVYNQHQFSFFAQHGYNKNENTISKPQWSDIAADNQSNTMISNCSVFTPLNNNKKALNGYPNKKDAIDTSRSTTSTTGFVEHQPMMYKATNENNNKPKTDIVRPIRRNSSPYIKHDNSSDDNNSYNNTVINNAFKRLSESMAFQMGSVGNNTLSLKRFAVVKITNIPWQVETKDIEQFFFHPSQDVNYQYVHLLINKSTGKTQKEAFVEFNSEKDLHIALKKSKSFSALKGRKVNIVKSSAEELFRNVFPNWKGEFIDNMPSITMNSNNDDHCENNPIEKSSRKKQHQELPNSTKLPPPLLVQGHEYDSLLNLCRNFKSSFSRKCPARPYENFISIMVKFPWDSPHIITTMQRDHLYEYYKLATGALRYHLDKPYPKFNDSLIVRMVRVAIICPGLTINQKKGILNASQILCPEDLIHYLTESPKEDNLSLEEK